MKNSTRYVFSILFIFGLLCSINSAFAQNMQKILSNQPASYNLEIPTPEADDYVDYSAPAKDGDQALDGDYKILVFNNLVYSEFIFYNAYWKYITGEYSGDTKFRDNVTSVPFSASTFNQYDITEYDLAVFPIGAYGLESHADGIKIIDKIMEILDAGGRVVVWAPVGLRASVGSGNANIRKFFDDYLGIDQIGIYEALSKSEGGKTTYYPWNAYGKYQDPIGLNMKKSCNAIGIWQGVEYEALVNYLNADIFKLKTGEEFEWFDAVEEQDNEWKVGTRRILDNKARIVYWSYGFENMHFDFNKSPNILAAMSWALMNKPDAGAQLDIIGGNSIDFKYVPVGDTAIKSLRLSNTGIETLVCDEFILDAKDFEDRVIMEFVDGTPDKVEIEPGTAVSLKIRFFPHVEGDQYLSIMQFHSNQPNIDGEPGGSYHSVMLNAAGGYEVFEGSHFSSNVTVLNFDEVNTETDSDMILEVHNKGQQNLEITKVELLDDENAGFIITDGDEAQTVDAGGKNDIKVRFHPKEELTYTATIKFSVSPPAENGTEFTVGLKGIGVNNEATGGNIFVVDDEKNLNFGGIEEGTTDQLTVNIWNNGNADLNISSIEWVTNDDDVFSFVSGNDTETIAEGGKAEVVVQFAPTEKKDFNGSFEIMSDALNEQVYTVNVHGVGGTDGVEEAWSSDRNFVMKVSPNPIVGQAQITLNYNGAAASNCKLYIVDLLGAKVKEISNSIVNHGASFYGISAANLVSGRYYIVAEMNGSIARLPIVVTK